jgi:hypothetical protein
MVTEDLHDQIFEALRDRKVWEDKQTVLYNLRHGRGKPPEPYPGAPNLKFKLSDALIEKLKPYYVQQLYSDETLATFVSLTDQSPALTTSLGYWFDYNLKHCSNFEREIYGAIDQMQEGGAVPIKTFWNAEAKMLAFDQVDPIHLIVPPWTKELYCADWLVHVLHYSEAQYRANPRYNKDSDLIKRIKGKGNAEDTGDSQKTDSVQWREGINCGKDDQIVLWEVYHKDSEDRSGPWVVDLISPVLPKDTTETIAPSFGLPFKHGQLPFSLLRYEITKKGHFAPRGVTELTASHESYLNRTWTSKAIWMQFNVNPNFESDNPIPNAVNFQNAPGKLLPAGLRKSKAEPPPLELDQEMNFTRALAEYRVQMPDLASPSHLVPGGRGAAGGERVTATAINAIVGQSGQGNDLRARIFRLDLGDIFKQAYSILLQYNYKSLRYLTRDGFEELDQAALHDKYIITPNGSPDSWNKSARLAKGISMVQLWQSGPMAQYIRWGEATKWLLEQDDPRLIKRLVADPQQMQQDQSEIQENEIVRILNNFAAQTHASDDDKTHCAVLLQFFDGRLKEQNPVTPLQAQAFIQHVQGHFQQLAGKKDKALSQIQRSLTPYLQILSQVAATPPSNVVPMQSSPNGTSSPSAGPAEGTAAPEPPPGQDPDERAKMAINAGNMLANMIGKGVPVSHADINQIFRELGLPDLPVQAVKPPPPVPHTPPKPSVKHVKFERDGSGKIAAAHIQEEVA